MTPIRLPQPVRRTAAALLATVAAAGLLTTTAAPPAAAADGECSDGHNKPYQGTPWSLQRVLLDQLWAQATGKGVKVAVIDTGVDMSHQQLKDAVDAADGHNFLPKNLKDKETKEPIDRGNANATKDPVGHGTRVAGIIAARPAKGTGFVGLAKDATIIPIEQNDAQGDGTSTTLAQSIEWAVSHKADVINISQDTTGDKDPGAALETAVEKAIHKGVVVVASSGNDGADGKSKDTYPAAYPGVLSVGASDRNNERAYFSQSQKHLSVAAPGVDMVSTVPGGGHCAEDGTSFSAPYVAAVAALIKQKHPDWTVQNIVAQIEQTADRSDPKHTDGLGWGIVDPVRALTDDSQKITAPHAHEGLTGVEPPRLPKLVLGETPAERTARYGTYVTVGAAVLVAALAGTAVAVRDARRRQQRVRGEG
jgi:type VII secretion-associated serine protease mycosin